MLEGENFMPQEEPKINQAEQSALEPELKKNLTANKPEEEISPESAENVAELLELWLKESQETEDPARKSELAYCILKMKEALGLAKLDASMVKIKDYDPGTGTLGYYLEGGDGEIGITPEGLNLPPEHFADVLVHEGAHAGTVTESKRILDEAFAEFLTKKIVPNALTGDYATEKQRVRKVLNEQEIVVALKKYDFDKPLPLTVYYLGIEWKDRFAAGIKEDYLKRKAEESFDEEDYLKDVLKNNADIKKNFKNGLPDIFAKLKEQNFEFDELGLDILKHLLRETKG